jgi:hypothetical protein
MTQPFAMRGSGEGELDVAGSLGGFVGAEFSAL